MLIDMHCDTISELQHKGEGENLIHNSLCVNLERMQQAETWIQFFACFVNAGKYERELQNRQMAAGNKEGNHTANWMSVKDCKAISDRAWEMSWQETLCLIERFRQEESEYVRIVGSSREIEEVQLYNQEIRRLHSGDRTVRCKEQNWVVNQLEETVQLCKEEQGTIDRCRNKSKIAAFPTLEEGGVLNHKIERLEELHQKGIRLITLTWNYENCIGYPNSRNAEIMQKGLKPFGFEVVERMNELGMLIDVSHLSDGGFWDCIQKSKVPIVASHSNARVLCNHPRNLSDEMLRALAEKGGVAGLNFYPAFIRSCQDEKKANTCSVPFNQSGGKNPGENSPEIADRIMAADIARHAKHMIERAGEDIVAIGTDFDGFETDITQNYTSHPGEMERLWLECKKLGITERQLDKIWWKNAWRVIKEVLKE